MKELRKKKYRATLTKLERDFLKKPLAQVNSGDLHEFIERLNNDDLEQGYAALDEARLSLGLQEVLRLASQG